MSSNTCMRCGAECAPGESMCNTCKKWLEEKKGGNATKSGLKKAPAFGAKPAASPTKKPAAKSADGLGSSFSSSRLSRLRGDKTATVPAAAEEETFAAPLENEVPVQEHVYDAPVETPATPAYMEEAPVWETPAAAAAESVKEETPVAPSEPVVPAHTAVRTSITAASKFGKVSGVAKAPGVDGTAPKTKATGAKNFGSFLPSDPQKRKQTLMMLGIVAAVVVIAIVMVIIFGGSGKKDNTAPELPAGTNDVPSLGENVQPDPGYEAEDSWGEYDPGLEVRPVNPAYTDEDLPGISLKNLTPQVASGNGDGFYFYSYGEDNVGGWYDNSIGGAESDTDNWCEYWLGGEYDAISGTVYLNYEYRNETARYTDLKIYGDGALLYQSNVVSLGSRPESFTVDIRGIRLLRVCIYGDAYLRLSDCRLYEDMNDAPVYEQAYEPLGVYLYEGGLAGYDRLYFTAASASSEIENKGKVYWASNAIDGDLTTSWQEDADDDGIGEFLMLYFDSEVEVELLCLRLGYAPYYERNGRHSELEFTFSDGSSTSCYFEDANRDVYIKFNRPVTTSFIKLTIQGVYTGSQWDDTCITEVTAFSGGSGSAVPDYNMSEGEPTFYGYMDPWDLVGTYSVQCATFSTPERAAYLAEQVYNYALSANKPWEIYLIYKDSYYAVYFGPYDSKDYATLEKDVFNASGCGEGNAFVVLNKEPED